MPPNLQARLHGIFSQYKDLFAKHKHHIGRFVGFKAEANIDFSKKINCKQPPRNRVLPPSCKQDLLKYKDAGLFANSTGMADHFCSNLTFVLRNQVKEQNKPTKADKNLTKHSKPTIIDTRPLETDKFSVAAPENQRSLYRMTIDLRNLNAVTTNQRTSQLPSIQTMEVNFHDSFVTTIDLANCYPSIEIKESSRDYFNFYVESEIWHHSRLPQGWGPSLQIAQSAIIWTFKDSTLQLSILTRKLTPAQFPYTSYRQFV